MPLPKAGRYLKVLVTIGNIPKLDFYWKKSMKQEIFQPVLAPDRSISGEKSYEKKEKGKENKKRGGVGEGSAT
jgi:hypothetical protein